MRLFLTLLKETPAQVFSCGYAKFLRAAFFTENPWWLLLKFFQLIPKRNKKKINRLVLKMFKCPFLIDLAFIILIRCSEHTIQLETIFFSEDFLVVVIHQQNLVIYMQRKTYIAFTCVNPISFYSLLLFLLFYSPLA